MQLIWWGILILSLSALIIVVLRNKAAGAWLLTMGLHIVAAAVLLVVVNRVGSSFEFSIPLNGVTLVVIGLLGIPGLLALTALKLLIV